MKRLLIVALLVFAASFCTPKAHAMPAGWVQVCLWQNAHVSGIYPGNGGWIVEVQTTCWYTNPQWPGYTDGYGWYEFYYPLTWVQKYHPGWL